MGTTDPADEVPGWREALAAAVEAAGGNKQAVANRLNVSRAYVSRVLSTGDSAYETVPLPFQRRVIAILSAVCCPARGGEEVPRTECAAANAPAPTHNPLRMQVWRKCQTCPQRPPQQQEEK